MAAPTLDGSAQASGSTNAILGATLTTTNANDIIVLVSYVAVTSGTPPSVSSISAGGLTFVRKTQANASARGNLELWWALAPSALTSQSISVTYASSYDDAAVSVFGVSGCYTTAPFDGNALSLKTIDSNVTYTPSFTVTTSQADDFLLFIVGGNNTNNGTLIGTPWTTLCNLRNPGGTNFAVLSICYLGVTATQSATTYTWGSSYSPTLSGGGGESMFVSLTADTHSGGGGGGSRRRVSDVLWIM